MNIEFFYNILIFSSIYFVLASGFNLFLKLRGTIDFSYIAIVVFASYASSILSNTFEIGILFSIFLSFVLTLPITIFILFLSKKLNDIYFVIGTFAIYMISLQLARNLDITGGVLGLSINSKMVFNNFYIGDIFHYLIFVFIISILVIVFITYFNKTYFFKILEGWGENELSIKSLGVKSIFYKFTLISLTAFLASLGAGMNAFYISYISPDSFWIVFIIPLILISLLSFKYSSIFTFLISIFIIGFYELLRLIPLGDYTEVGYYREMIFAILVMVSSYFIFKKFKDFRYL